MTRSLLALALLLASTALAQPSPAEGAGEPSMEASAQLHEELKTLTGLAKAERLLTFAAEHPADPAAQQAVKDAREILREVAQQAPRADPLLDALVQVFSAPSADRGAKLRALTALGDVRAVPALGYVARRDEVQAIRVLAASLLGDLPSPDAEAMASAIAQDAKVDPLVRANTIASLGRMQRESVVPVLTKLATDTEQPAPVRQAAVDELRQRYPAVAEQLHLGPKVATSSGRTLATLVGAASGGYTLGLVGALSPSDAAVGTTVGALGGLVIGGAAANLLSRGDTVDQGDAELLLSAALWSVPVGWFAGTLTGGPTASCTNEFTGSWNDGCTAVALGVHVASMAGAWLAMDHLTLDLSDVVEVNAAALSGLLIGIGAVQIPPHQNDERPGVAIVAALPAVGFIVGAAFADKLHLEGPMGRLSLAAAAQGALTGGALAAAFAYDNGPLGTRIPSPRYDDIVTASTILGLGAGLGGMLAASAAWHPSGSEADLLIFSTLDGDFIGAALPLLFGGRWNDGIGKGLGAAIGGPIAATAVGLMTPRLGLKVDDGDRLLVALGTGFAAFQGYGWGVLADDQRVLNNDRSAGLAFAIAGFGGAGLLAVSQKLTLQPAHAGWLYSGAVWGGWLAGWSAFALDAGNDAILAAALLGSDLGLVVSALALSPLFEVSPATAAWVSIFGVGGMTTASMIATFVSYQSQGHTIATANVIGTAVGLGLGAYFAPKIAGSGGDIPGARWMPDVPLPSASAMPVLDPSGQRVEGMGAQLVWSL